MSAMQYDTEESMTTDLRCIIHPAEKKTKFWSLICMPGLRYLELVKKHYCVTHAVLDPSSSKDEDLGKSVLVMIKYRDEDRIIAVLRHGMTDHVSLGLVFDQEDVTFYIKGNGVVHLLGYEIIWKERKKEVCENGISPEKDDKDHSITVDSTQAATKEVLNVSKRSKRASSSSDVHTPSTSKGKSVNSPGIGKSSSSKKDRVSSGKKARSPKNETFEEVDDFSKIKQSLSSSDDNVGENHSDEDVDEEEEYDDDMDEEIEDADEQEVDDDVVEVEESDEDDDGSDSIQDSEDNDSVDDEYFVKKSKKQKNQESEAQKSHQSQVPSKRKKNANIDMMPKKRSKLEKSSKVSVDAQSSGKNRFKENSVPKEVHNQQMSKKKKKKEQYKIPIDVKEDKPGFKEVQGVRVKDLREGFGPVAIKGKLVSVFYVGKFVDKNLFDSVLPNSKPLSFRLGSGKMIKGFEIGLEGMKVGGKRKIIVPPNLGYGRKGFENVPPNSILYYTIDLTNVS